MLITPAMVSSPTCLLTLPPPFHSGLFDFDICGIDFGEEEQLRSGRESRVPRIGLHQLHRFFLLMSRQLKFAF